MHWHTLGVVQQPVDVCILLPSSGLSNAQHPEIYWKIKYITVFKKIKLMNDTIKQGNKARLNYEYLMQHLGMWKCFLSAQVILHITFTLRQQHTEGNHLQDYIL